MGHDVGLEGRTAVGLGLVDHCVVVTDRNNLDPVLLTRFERDLPGEPALGSPAPREGEPLRPGRARIVSLSLPGPNQSRECGRVLAGRGGSGRRGRRGRRGVRALSLAGGLRPPAGGERQDGAEQATHTDLHLGTNHEHGIECANAKAPPPVLLSRRSAPGPQPGRAPAPARRPAPGTSRCC
jgi:hypothetical protein